MYVKEVKQGSLADQAGGLVEGQVIAALNNRIAMGLHGSDVVQIWTSNTTVSFMVTGMNCLFVRTIICLG